MALETEYKALTRIHLPFVEKDFTPGQMIPLEDFEAYETAAAALLEDRTEKDENASPIPTAESEIDRMIEWGALSADPNAPLHPDSEPVDPNKLTVTGVIAQAKALIEQLQEAGKPVPDEIQTLVDEYNHVASGENGSGVDNHA